METLLTDDILDYLTEIGDPLVDPKVKARSKRKASKEQLLRDLNEARNKGLSSLKGDWLTKNATSFGVDRLLENPGTLPDPDLVKTACDLFARYGSEIAAALLLAALPEAYAAGEGAKVLIDRSQLAKGGTVSTRRILATAQFVIWVLTPDTSGGPVSGDMKEYTYQSFDDTLRLWGPGKDRGQALRASLALRIMHSLIRTSRPDAPRGLQLADDDGVPLYQIDDPDDVPLNQTDLLATLLSFSITVFEVLEKFGIYWTAEEQEAFFYVWDHVGNTLGIGDTDVVLKLTGTESLEDLKKTLRAFDEGDDPPAGGCSLSPTDTEKLFKGRLNRRVLRRVADVGNLRPQSVPEARALLARLRERMWTLEKDSFPEREPFPYENFNKILDDVSSGRILLKAMVDQVATYLPPSQKTWPIAVIRQLVPPEVQNRLALGGTSSIGFLGGVLGTPRDSPGSVVLRRLTAEVLRQRATRVANALFLHYYDEGLLQIPGLLSTAVRSGVLT